MASRKRIGILFYYNEDWIAGSYYILNLILALKTIEGHQQPTVVIISNSKTNFKRAKKETKYPFLDYFEIPFKPPYTIWDRAINKIGKLLLGKGLIRKKPKQPNIDFLYPFQKDGIKLNHLKKVNWVPDFQEIHLPHLFSEKMIQDRKAHYEEIINKGDVVVFSSFDAQKDYESLFPEVNIQKHVLNFAVTHPDFSNQNIKDLRIHYDLPKRYYFCPNQFWAHKNHITVLKAIKKIKEDGRDVFVAFSGKEDDHRNTDYIHQLKRFIKENQLEAHIRFLGFLPRKEQLCLMQNSLAIIQPSLFEGWSTVVEDAKALNKFLLLSKLNVHQEQIEFNVEFFEPKDYGHLAELMIKFQNRNPKTTEINYDLNRKKFALDFLNIIQR